MYLVYPEECCGTFELVGNGSAKVHQAEVFGCYNSSNNELFNGRPLFANKNGLGFIFYRPHKKGWVVSLKMGMFTFDQNL